MRAAGYNVDAEVLWLRRCPAAEITHFTRRMLEWWIPLDEWHVTPGAVAPADDLDPRFWPAMMTLKREQRRVEREEFERAKAETKT